jgi:hypothetical protein
MQIQGMVDQIEMSSVEGGSEPLVLGFACPVVSVDSG